MLAVVLMETATPQSRLRDLGVRCRDLKPRLARKKAQASRCRDFREHLLARGQMMVKW